jgi:hypothetical protein
MNGEHMNKNAGSRRTSRRPGVALQTSLGSILLIGSLLAARDARAAAFHSAGPADVNWIRHDTDFFGGVYNTDTQAAHSATAPGSISSDTLGGAGFTMTVYGLGNGGTISCWINAYGLTTRVSASSPVATYSGTSSFVMTVNVPSATLGVQRSGLYAYGVLCSVPPVNANGRAHLFLAQASTDSGVEIEGAGWIPTSSGDVGSIAYTPFSVINFDSANPHSVSAAIPPRQLAAGNHTVTFHGIAGSTSTVCFLYYTDLATRTLFSRSVTITAPAGTSYAQDATTSLPSGRYDIGFTCKLPPSTRLFGARNFR